jgi:hypothetical protein
MPLGLDQLLEAWGTAQRLSPERADRIRAEIIAPPALPTAWWVDFNGRLAGAFLQSNGVASIPATAEVAA